MEDSDDGLHLFRAHAKYSQPKDESANMAKQLLDAFKRHSERVLLVGTQSGRQWTGANLLNHCAKLATGLIKQVGIKPNDVVMTICDHADDEVAMALSVVLSGGAIFGTTPTDGYAEMETLCSIVKPNIFIISSQYHSIAAKLRNQIQGLQEAKIVWLDRQISAQSNGSMTINNGTNHNGRFSILSTNTESERVLIERDHVYLIENLLTQAPDYKLVESVANEQIDAKNHIITYMLTSGSTGRPKVVPSTHEELIHGQYSMISACFNEMIFEARNNSNNKSIIDENGNQYDENNNYNHKLSSINEIKSPLMPCGPDEIVSGDLPLDHGAGFNTMFLSIWLGSKFIVMPSYDVDVFWQAVNDYKISLSISSTTFCYKLFTSLKEMIARGETKRWNLDSFKYISCCGAKMAFADLIKEVQQHFPHIKVTQAYGCTEIGFISMLHQDDCHSHLNATGYLFPGLLAKVVDADDSSRLCGPNERGELLVWARSKFKNYRCHADDDAQKIYTNCHDNQGLFYKTGDQAHFDDQGRLYIHGRFKDTLVLMEDWKILPVELEDVVNEHPLVEMSAVVGIPDPNLPGCHAPKAFVKLISPSSVAFQQLSGADKELGQHLIDNDLEFVKEHIYDFVASKTARPKHLTGGVRIIEEFPRVGLLNKVDRKVLMQMA